MSDYTKEEARIRKEIINEMMKQKKSAQKDMKRFNELGEEYKRYLKKSGRKYGQKT